MFRKYDERQTRLDVLLATGRFNCVSSAVLYGLLARSLGLEFRAVQTPDHAFIRVLRTKGWDVETTNPYGFDPGSRREFTDSFGRVTGYSYVPPGQYSRRKELGDKGLLALILYNRNAYDTEAGRYLEALQPAVDAHALRRDAESARAAGPVLPERGLLSTAMAGRYEEGVGFLDEAGRWLDDPRLAQGARGPAAQLGGVPDRGPPPGGGPGADRRSPGPRGAVREGVAQPGGVDLAAARPGRPPGAISGRPRPYYRRLWRASGRKRAWFPDTRCTCTTRWPPW